MQYERPADVASAIGLLKAPGAMPLGGGTDLLVTMREGLAAPRQLVDLRALPEAKTIREDATGALVIGSAVPLAQIAEHHLIRERFSVLSDACESVGSPALRNMGTLGGNLGQRPRCAYFRSGVPCLKTNGADCPAAHGDNTHHAILGAGSCIAVNPSDPAVALAALEATIVVNGPRGEYRVGISEFFVLPVPDPRRENVLGTGEFITSVMLPPLSSGGRQRYAKVLQRGAWDFALVSIAAVRRRDGSVRLVLGGVAPVPWRVNSSVEEDIASAPLSADDIDVLADRAMYDARPLARNGYKVTLARNLLRECMTFLQDQH